MGLLQASDAAELPMAIQRAGDLTSRQSEVFLLVVRYHRLTGEGCPANIVANKLEIGHKTAREHFAALFRKGWLMTDASPAVPRRRYLARTR